ncbi:MAG: tRNA (adenosine(37)-N6)-dimethylallyltransferase MiaA [Spirochaetales bacterium]|nr:tRNA (adenosine(37)-N6)-dimethylallyltransferase MiaA [Spirochaetales bacterium]
MRRKTSENRAVVLFGPTAVGKTALTEELFSKGFEIINADSVQVYRFLDIASAKPEKELVEKIPHHLVDIRFPWEQYNSGDFCKDAERLIKEINERGNIPLITGGTAYYFKQLLYGPSSTPESNPKTREEIQRTIDDIGLDKAYEMLMSLDMEAAKKIDKNDRYRISRALEVIKDTGRPLSSFPVSDTLREDIDFVIIGLKREKKELEDRIRKRVDRMFDSGAVREMKALLSMGADLSWPGMQGIGYREWFNALESGEVNISIIKDMIIRSSIKYAKRQMTFFSSFSDTLWFSPNDIEKIKEYLKERNIIV